jgi:hypothetical protein
VGRVEQEAAVNQKLRKALSNVWRANIQDGVWRRIEPLRLSSK